MINYYHKRITSLFKRLNILKENIENVHLSYAIQEELINVTRRIEYKVRREKENCTNLNSILKNDRPIKSYSKELKNEIYNINNKIDSYQYILSIFRDIGDGIAFLYINKWDIKPLCLAKERAGFISKKKGFRLELKRFRLLRTYNIQGIYNDITNSIRYGDLTLCHNGVPSIIEIKSGSQSKRDKRQKERLQQIVNYLKDDRAVGIYPNLSEGQFLRIELSRHEQDNRLVLNELLLLASTTSQSQLSKIEEGLYYHIALPESDQEVLEELYKNNKKAWWYIHFINEEKRKKEGYYPFTLSITNPEYLFEFYSGNILIAVYIDMSIVAKKLKRKSLIFEVVNQSDNLFSVSHAEYSLGKVFITRHFFNRVGAEFLSLKWMIDEIISHCLYAFEEAR